MSEEPEAPCEGKTAAQAIETVPNKNRVGKEELPLAFIAYLGMAGVVGIVALISGQEGLFFCALGLLALAELTLARRAWELCGERARRRMEYPPCEPPLRDGASQEEIALAWADIACRASAHGDSLQARRAWALSDEALKREGSIK